MKLSIRSLVLAVALSLPGVAAAQGAEAGDSPDDRATAFRAVTGAEQEQVPGGALLVGAYGLVFGLTLLYVIRLAALARGTDARIARLEGRLEEVERRAERGAGATRPQAEGEPR